MSADLPITLVQLHSEPGNLQANLQQIAHTITSTGGNSLLVFPELFLSGTQLRGLFHDPALPAMLQMAEKQLCQLSCQRDLLLGLPLWRNGRLYNGCALFSAGKMLWQRAKPASAMTSCLNESLYFTPADDSQLLHYRNYRILVLLGSENASSDSDCDLAISLQTDFFRLDRQQQREQHLAAIACQLACPLLLINSSGAHEQWVFSGQSAIFAADGKVLARASAFIPDQLDYPAQPQVTAQQSEEELIYQALVCSIRSYVRASHSKGVVLGLSGGIDSALALALAVDALGPEQVTAVMMPYHYTAQISLDDAAQQAQMLGINYHQLPIAGLVESFARQLQPVLDGWPPGVADTTEQNLQARSRGMLLMAISNRSGALLLTTSNKSEMAVGYCTLYGDMAGGFAPLKDVPKTLVYRLASYRNRLSAAIPQRVIERPPSAELAPDQLDIDNLPPYELLDEIIHRHIELRQSQEQIIAAGLDAAAVQRVVRLIGINEYKRRQAATGPQITSRSFGIDYQAPLNAVLTGPVE